MVRIKHRYLLLNILFPAKPSNSTSTSTTTTTPSTLPTTQLVLSHHAPTPPHFHAASLVALIRDSVAELFGDYGVGVISGLKVVYFSPATSTAIVRCPRAGYRVVWAGVTFVGSLPLPGAPKRRGATREGSGVGAGTACVIRVVRVSGTIRKAEEEAVRRARREIVRVKGLDLDQGVGSGGGLLDGLLRGGGSGQGGDVALGRENDEAGIEDMSEGGGGEDVDDDSG